jgi:hypothetical protein
MKSGEEFLQLPETVQQMSKRVTISFFGTGESGNIHLNSFWQVKLKQDVG